MIRDQYTERRLLNWARWRAGAGDVGLGYGSASMWNTERVDHSPRRDAVIPTNAVEASETEDAINSLPGFLKMTVHVYYLSDESVEVMAQRLVCGVSTVHSRIRDAHRKIATWFSDRAMWAAAERRRNEEIQAVARVVSMGLAAAIVLPPLTKRASRRKK